MAKLKGYKKPLSSILEWSVEEQARFIERETKNVIKRLPRLKSALQMYGEMSDELYNMNSEELSLMGTTYARAIRGGEISTPSSKKAYQRFISNLRRYSRTSIKQLAVETAQARLDDWLKHIKANSTKEDIAYAESLLSKLTDEQKIGFTKSKYFLDTEIWNSQETFMKSFGDEMYSIQTLKLELYCVDKGIDTDNKYLDKLGKGKTTTDELREYHLKSHKRKRKG